MAIAYDATAHGNTAGATSLTFSHTCGTGANRILWVSFRVGSNSDLPTGVTYGGIAMTQAIKRNDASGTQYAYLYYLVNPATGANNVVITLSLSASIVSASASYTGAKQSGQPDASGSNGAAPGTSVSTSITVVAASSWVISFVCNDGTLAMTNSTGVVSVRDNGSFASNVISLGDSNAGVSAGSYTTTWTSSSQVLTILSASFSPSVDGGFLALF